MEGWAAVVGDYGLAALEETACPDGGWVRGNCGGAFSLAIIRAAVSKGFTEGGSQGRLDFSATANPNKRGGKRNARPC